MPSHLGPDQIVLLEFRGLALGGLYLALQLERIAGLGLLKFAWSEEGGWLANMTRLR